MSWASLELLGNLGLAFGVLLSKTEIGKILRIRSSIVCFGMGLKADEILVVVLATQCDTWLRKYTGMKSMIQK